MTAYRPTLAERARRIVARGLAALPPGWQVRLSGEAADVHGDATLDPHVQLVRALRRRTRRHGLCEPTPAVARARFRRETLAFAGRPTAVGAVRDLSIDGPAGPLALRHYAPPAHPGDEGRPPLTVYLHGGGFVLGDLDTHDEPCRMLCRYGGMHVLSVDYRLAPEHVFPAALDDASAALRWAQAHASALGADPAAVGIGGDSAGGNLAAAATLLAAREERPPAAQLLLYPATDDDPDSASQVAYTDDPFLSRADRQAFSAAYLTGSGFTGRDPRVSPLLAPDLSQLPPALVVAAAFDVLRDEGEAYAAALNAAGSPAHLVRVPLAHGFVHLTGVTPAARLAMISLALRWRALLDRRG
jgi:acetyl esterase